MAKKITIDDLAGMVKRGFDDVHKRLDQTATKDDLQALHEEMATKDDLHQLEQKMEDGFRAVNRRIDLLHEDVSDLPDLREEVRDLGKRMERVEQKVGLAR